MKKQSKKPVAKKATAKTKTARVKVSPKLLAHLRRLNARLKAARRAKLLKKGAKRKGR